MSSKIQLRRGTAVQWTSEVLASGEIGYETDTGNLKIGDGATAWGSLSYYMSPLLTSANVDLNNADYLRMGRFDLAAPATTYTNGPSLLDAAEGASKLIVTKTGTGYIQQIVSQNYFFTRAYIGGSWQAWKELPTSATLNTVNTLVRRDASGNFAAGTITATLTGTATALATARTIAITGDVAYSQSFDGSANITGAGTLATVATAGTTGSASLIPVVTINAKGLTTGISTVAVVADANTLTNTTLKSTVTASSLTSFGSSPTLITPLLGTPTSGVLTNCTSSSSPSGSTNLATKGYVDQTSSLVASGYQKFSSGLYLQWGSLAIAGVHTASYTITFPIAFPTNFFSITLQPQNNTYSTGSGVLYTIIQSTSTTTVTFQFGITTGGTTATTIKFIATGN